MLVLADIWGAFVWVVGKDSGNCVEHWFFGEEKFRGENLRWKYWCNSTYI